MIHDPRHLWGVHLQLCKLISPVSVWTVLRVLPAGKKGPEEKLDDWIFCFIVCLVGILQGVNLQPFCTRFIQHVAKSLSSNSVLAF